jgi:NTE family protein
MTDTDKDRAAGASQFPAVLPDSFGEPEGVEATAAEASHDPTAEWTGKRAGMGLALSGGGFRATLFGLGSLWRLNELGLLLKMTRITSVSGGSLAAGVLAAHWKDLNFSADGRATNFEQVVVARLREFCRRTLDWKVALLGLVPFLSAARLASKSYARHLTRMGDGRGATLADLPAKGLGPDFVFYATCMQTGSSFRFSREGLYDWKLGYVPKVDVPLATAMAASAGFPPVLAPLKLKTDPTMWRGEKAVSGLKDPDAIRRSLILSDGGVYDNMGIEALWKTMQWVLVSDAGAPFEFTRSSWANWFGQLGRVRDVLIQQTRALRKRMLMADFTATPAPRYGGAYWGIGTQIKAYSLNTCLCSDSTLTAALPLVSTRLRRLDPQTQERLINWGYALTDAAIRTHVDPSAAMGTLPYPATTMR